MKMGSKIVAWCAIALIFALLAVIAIPCIVPARNYRAQLSCRNQLLMLNDAVCQWAITAKAANGTLVTVQDITSSLPKSSGGTMKCPDGGQYNLIVGQLPQCSLGGALHTCPSEDTVSANNR
jgi:hypothetical protein